MSQASSRRARSGAAAPAARDGLSALPASVRCGLIAMLVLIGGAFLGLASPQRPNWLIWPIMFVPMFLALDMSLRGWRGGRWSWLLRVVGCTYPCGIVFSAVTGDWVVNTAHVFGGLAWPLAYGVSWFGFGSLFGMELVAFVGLPFALAWRRPRLLMVLLPLWATVGQVYAPRFLTFSYGQAMVTVPPLVQFADVLGSGGLNLLCMPLQLVLYLWLRRLYVPDAPDALALRTLRAISALLALGFVAAYGYGVWQMERWAAREAAGTPVQFVGIQPNFTLAHLTDHPELAHSTREQDVRTLLQDSVAALRRATPLPGVPTVLLWPESVFPGVYFGARELREFVERWVRQAGVHLILTSLQAQSVRRPGGEFEREVYGASIHVGPEGSVRGVYHKIALIPWGETVPLGDWIPGLRNWLLEAVPQMSQFTAGTEPTVFALENGLRIAPMICFDASTPHVAQRMAANGARVGVVLANLAWFGRTSVSDQFGWFARFRAIENRMPVLFLSQNGESLLLDSRGQEAAPRLPQFEPAAFVGVVRGPVETSFYALHATLVERGFVAALLLVAGYGWRRELRRLLLARGRSPRR